MNIKYKNRKKKPSLGDLKVTKDGKKFIRHFRKVGNKSVLSNGVHQYEWFDYDSEIVALYRKEIESGKAVVNLGSTVHIKMS